MPRRRAIMARPYDSLLAAARAHALAAAGEPHASETGDGTAAEEEKTAHQESARRQRRDAEGKFT